MAMAVKGENLVVTKLKLERMLSMKGGKGETSYLKNSQAQVLMTSSCPVLFLGIFSAFVR